jgi:hypothetical protein
MEKRRFSSPLISGEITNFAKCTTVMSRAHGYERSGILSRLDGLSMVWFW